MAEFDPSLKSLYVGCCLTGAPDSFTSKVEDLKDVLRPSYNVYDFVGLVSGTSEDVYRWDIENCVANCDMFVGICDYPSIGLGWELSESIHLDKPTLAVAHEDSKVTRLVIGAAAIKSVFNLERYQNMVEDVPRIIAEQFAISTPDGMLQALHGNQLNE